MQKTVLLKINGKVQGVFYRKSAKQKAEETGVTGYVKNEPDGSVFIKAAGTGAQLRSFITWCQRGPAEARVSSILISEAEYEPFPDFSIRKG